MDIKHKSSFRYDINALRAIAVLGVVAFHFKIPFFGGGFAGVDIFFVISGYLMTRIVLNGLNMGNFSILDFYKRRVERIVPALIFLITIIIAVSFFVYFPGEFHTVVKNSLASILFYSNILYYHGNYFDASSETNILLHTWSLSVEWQYYLVLPILLIILHKTIRFNRNKYLIIFSLGTILLSIISLYVTKNHFSAGFYLFPFRAWEMLIGGVAFLSEGMIRYNWRKPLAILCYIILIICLCTLNNRMMWPGLFTFIPVLATFAIIITNINDFAILKNKAVQFFGKISYSLYLWHWPIFVMASNFGVKLDPLNIIAMFILSTLAALISYNVVETWKGNKVKYVLILETIVATSCIGLLFNNLNSSVFDKRILDISEYKERNRKEIIEQFSENCCFITGTDSLTRFDHSCLRIKSGKKNILLFGDSHAAQFSQSFRQLTDSNRVNIMQATVGGTLPLLHRKATPIGDEVFDNLFKHFIPDNASQIDCIILSAYWANTDYNIESIMPDIQETITYIKKLGIPIIIIGQHETYTYSFVSLAARESRNGGKLAGNYNNQKATAVNKIMMSRLGNDYINIYNINAKNKMSESNVPYMIDADHFTKYGADYVVKRMLEMGSFKQVLN